MDNELYFSMGLEPEWKQNFSQEALEYLISAQEKAFYSILDMNGFYDVKKATSDAYDSWREKLFRERHVSHSPDDRVEYFGNKVPSNLLLDKIHLNFFSTIHSFFDTYAHFVHLVLFPSTAIPKKLYFGAVELKIKRDASMTALATLIGKFTSQEAYSYINDMDNTNKHRRHISPESILFLNDGEQITEVPAFEKDGRPYSEKPMQDLFEDITKFVTDFFTQITATILDHIKKQ